VAKAGNFKDLLAAQKVLVALLWAKAQIGI